MHTSDLTLMRELMGPKSELSLSETPGIVISDIVCRLMSEVSVPLEEDNCIFLNIFCRKTDIARRIYKRYTESWKPANDGELESPQTVLAIALVLAIAVPANSPNKLGLRLKWLNSAYNAVQLAQNMTPFLPIDIELVRQILDREVKEVLEN